VIFFPLNICTLNSYLLSFGVSHILGPSKRLP